MRTLFITLSAIAILTSCSEKQPIVFSNDTEPSQEWLNQETIKPRPNAHSGKTVSVIDSINTYSLGFKKTFKDIATDKIKTATLSYWVYLKNSTAKANTVYSVDFEGKNVNWEGPPLHEKVKEYNKWVQVSETFNIKDNTDPKSTMTFYVWNISKEEILVDDIKITFK